MVEKNRLLKKISLYKIEIFHMLRKRTKAYLLHVMASSLTEGACLVVAVGRLFLPLFRKDNLRSKGKGNSISQ